MMYDAYNTRAGWWSILFHITLFVLGNWIVINMFLAILLSADHRELEEEKKQLGRVAAAKLLAAIRAHRVVKDFTATLRRRAESKRLGRGLESGGLDVGGLRQSPRPPSVSGAGCRVQGEGCRVQGAGCVRIRCRAVDRPLT